MIDDTSLKILQILQKKARIPNVEVARQVGLAPSAVLERIRKLEKQGIIDGYEKQGQTPEAGRSTAKVEEPDPLVGQDQARLRRRHFARVDNRLRSDRSGNGVRDDLVGVALVE